MKEVEEVKEVKECFVTLNRAVLGLDCVLSLVFWCFVLCWMIVCAMCVETETSGRVKLTMQCPYLLQVADERGS